MYISDFRAKKGQTQQAQKKLTNLQHYNNKATQLVLFLKNGNI